MINEIKKRKLKITEVTKEDLEEIKEDMDEEEEFYARNYGYIFDDLR